MTAYQILPLLPPERSDTLNHQSSGPLQICSTLFPSARESQWKLAITVADLLEATSPSNTPATSMKISNGHCCGLKMITPRGRSGYLPINLTRCQSAEVGATVESARRLPLQSLLCQIRNTRMRKYRLHVQEHVADQARSRSAVLQQQVGPGSFKRGRLARAEPNRHHTQH